MANLDNLPLSNTELMTKLSMARERERWCLTIVTALDNAEPCVSSSTSAVAQGEEI